MAEYKVYHFKQNENDDEYTLEESESLEGVVGAQTEAALKDYEGFTAQSFIQTVISEDGSACVEIKYDRNRYTVKFDGNGASGNIPDISAKYGVEFTLPENTFASPFGFRAGAWNTEKDGSGTSYAANEKIKNLAVENNAVVSLDAMVPKNHLLRKIDAVIDFDAIYDIVKDLYCEDNGRPSIDPVVLFKIVLLQHIYGIPSLRRTLDEINMNMAYRWFLGYAINDAIPHFSTVSYNFKHRFTPETVEDIFQWVLNLAADGGCLDSYAVFIDGTHIKANANMRKKANKKA